MLLNIRLGWKLLTVIHALAYCDYDLIKPLKISVVKVPDGSRKFRNFITFLRRRKSGTKFLNIFQSVPWHNQDGGQQKVSPLKLPELFTSLKILGNRSGEL